MTALPIFYKDLLAGHRTYSEEEVGRKGLSLALLTSNNVPVPPYVIFPPEVYRALIATIFQDTSVSSLEAFRKKILDIPLSPQVMSHIETEYQKLSGFGKAWVAVRSSIVAPLHPDLAFSGMLHSQLNVRGATDIENATKQVFASLFNDRMYDYLKKHSVSYGDISTAVIVQKMIQAEVSGIMYTYDPITLDTSHVSIEAVFGLGDVLADGSINPDVYTVSKESLDIVEKKIVPQDWMKVRKVGDSESLEHLQRISISKVWQYSQKLDDSLIRELTKLADSIEKALGGPQLIEWAMERGVLYILQSKPLKTAAQVEEASKDKHTHKISTPKDLDGFTKLSDDVPVTVHQSSVAEKEPDKVALPAETLLFTGTGASSGIVYGSAYVIVNTETITEEYIASIKETITKKSIIVTNEFSALLEPLFLKAGGIITNYGGLNSDAAITARELQIPAVVGTRIATSFIQQGTLLKIDGASGAVYRVEFLPQQPTEKAETHLDTHEKEHLHKAVKAEQSKRSLLPPATDTPVKVFLQDHPTATAQYLVEAKATISHNPLSAVMVPVHTGDKSEIVALKRLKKKTTADLYLVLSDIPSIESLLKVKRTLAANGIRRTKRVKLLISIGSIYGLLNSKNLADVSVDGFVYNASALAASYQPGNTTLDSQLISLIADNMNSIKPAKLNIIALQIAKEYFTIPLRKELLPLIKSGVSALIFSEEIPHATDKDIHDIEGEMMNVQLGK